MLEHAIKRAQSRLETVATLVAQLTRVFPVAGVTGVRLDSVWQDIAEVIDDLEFDIQGTRKVHTDLKQLLEEWDDHDNDKNGDTTRPPDGRRAA